MVLAIFLENLAFKRHLGESEISVGLCKTNELITHARHEILSKCERVMII